MFLTLRPIFSTLLVFLSLGAGLSYSSMGWAHSAGQGQFDISKINSKAVLSVKTSGPPPFTPHPTTEAEQVLSGLVERLTLAPKNQKLLAGFKFNVTLERSDEVGGRSWWDGQIRLNDALILAAENENRVLSTIAHEMGHAIRAHEFRLAEAGEGGTPFLVDRFGGRIGTIVYEFVALPRLSRAFEFEADAIAMELLDNAGINPRNLPLALETFHAYEKEVLAAEPKVTGMSGRLLEGYMRVSSSHPETSARITEAEAEVTRHRYASVLTDAIEHAPSVEFIELLRLLGK